ncbi:bifunctional UDP-N-acetylmuramoyl-L-alanyl-D-glutamate--2,6-diaminopimelate ligase MurE/UDP-N-acetylmuramoyl-tripeptide--D-alanyl-D-alanine ligase MurF [Alcaligenaceae bacterium SJ-26]|nr:bifunctional UDP-N-acetylmuramoyl-L-alanyl-D-glutamate--2,6-diaminopimelate ligase MurE/UDP-N-acetylmuramoyl-tripeptide--D-alanyl-D-alanine ligase MurF [Alcaligenaceae bacterium SJ-26]
MTQVISMTQRVANLVGWLREQAGVAASARLRLDSRQVRAGDVFVACPGIKSDGRAHIRAAFERGAAAVLCEARADLPADGPLLQVEGLGPLLGELAHEWYGRPSESMSVVAVTGTNGKTSCAWWIAQAWARQRHRPAGVIGTLGAHLPDGSVQSFGLTTPDVLMTHDLLAQMRDQGAECVAIEASSIGLVQGRLEGVRVDVAGWTNLTHDHLDFHGDMMAYEAAKMLLFVRSELRAAIVNEDDAAGARLLARLRGLPTGTSLQKVLGYRCAPVETSASAPSEAGRLSAVSLEAGATGQIFSLCEGGSSVQVVTPLIGQHNVSNLLLVGGVLRAQGWTLAEVAGALGRLGPVPGRLQAVDVPWVGAASPAVIVDYAHTPDALAHALQALRPLAQARQGRLVCVFGCGGDRDARKRPEMGRIAAEQADVVVLTSDNPRSEPPADILAEIAAGVTGSHEIHEDRAVAIMVAVLRARPEDVVLVAGKGHETTQQTGAVTEAFDDVEWSRLALSLRVATGVSTDTRTLQAGALYVALHGERFDGHAFIDQAAVAGAVVAVVDAPVTAVGLPQIALGNTRRALGRMAHAWRAVHDLSVVAVTGSNGKTTTKEMIASIFRHALGERATLATAGNQNNDIGVPLTLLRLRPEHRAAVVELGMNHPDEILGLARMTAPTVALVNNAQREHQEFMHTVEAVARENGQVLTQLSADGVAVFPAQDTYDSLWQSLAGERMCCRFGIEAGEVRASEIRLDALGVECTVRTPVGAGRLRLQVAGEHNLRNALAATACTLAAGVSLSMILEALAVFVPVGGRMQAHTLPGDVFLIDDTYNADPDSVRAAIDVLAGLPAPRVLALGDMGEVGTDEVAMHEEVGAYARARGVDLLCTLGRATRDSARAFGAGAQICESVEEVVNHIQAAGAASILVKGSRFMRMERIVLALRQAAEGAAATEGAHHVA